MFKVLQPKFLQHFGSQSKPNDICNYKLEIHFSFSSLFILTKCLVVGVSHTDMYVLVWASEFS